MFMAISPAFIAEYQMESISNAISSVIAKVAALPHAKLSIQPQAMPHFNSEANPQHQFLLPNWMRCLPDHCPVSTLSIPGTHNSASYHSKVYQAPFSSQCQSWSIYDQLRAGIRFLDIRVNSGKQLFTAHGIVQFKHLSEEIEQIRRFLAENPSQFLIIAFKQNNEGEDPSEQILDLFQGKLDAIFSQEIPAVRDLRGKCWILSNPHIKFAMIPTFQLPSGGPKTLDSPNLFIQDQYSVSYGAKEQAGSVEQKINGVMSAIFGVEVNPRRLKVNYLSACGVGLLERPFPYELAKEEKGTNFAVNSALQVIQAAFLGITVIDFPGQELIHKIVECNFR